VTVQFCCCSVQTNVVVVVKLLLSVLQDAQLSQRDRATCRVR